MQLIKELYTIKGQREVKGQALFRVSLNPDCFIYKVHFPNNPITPGACLVQMLVELFGTINNKKFAIEALKNVKFIAPISPLEYPEFNYTIDFAQEDDVFHLKASAEEKGKIFAKISATVR